MIQSDEHGAFKKLSWKQCDELARIRRSSYISKLYLTENSALRGIKAHLLSSNTRRYNSIPSF